MKIKDTLNYPHSYIWIWHDGYGEIADIILNDRIEHVYSLDKVPEKYHSLPVVKNLDYLYTPAWANVIHVENMHGY